MSVCARTQPSSTPYQGGTFEVAIDFPIEYPFKGPKLRFLTPVYHPNVDKDGNMCVGVIKAEAWKPSTKASTSESLDLCASPWQKGEKDQRRWSERRLT